MKTKKMILLLTILIPLFLHAQCLDCNKKENDWKFAAGVTLYSNNHYVAESDILERQPLELNFRYKLNDKHVFRLNLPMAWKVNLHYGDTEGSITDFTADTGNKVDDYLEGMRNDYWHYADFYKKTDYYYNLLGASAGYSMNHYFGKGLSLFAGIDLGCVFYHNYASFYKIGYYELNDNNISELRSISYVERINNYNKYSVKPLVGINFRYQKLLLDISGGYSFSAYKVNGSLMTQYPKASSYTGLFERDFMRFNQFIYQISLYYTF
jgi:hypothetical protein